jgi:hypothetical protein
MPDNPLMSKKEYEILPSECDEEPSYRYRLVVSTLMQSSKRLIIVQLNPSKGSATRSDPTMIRPDNREGFALGKGA